MVAYGRGLFLKTVIFAQAAFRFFAAFRAFSY